MNNKLDFSILENAEVYTVSYANVDNIDSNYVKKIREKLGLTQIVFSQVIGVTKKTVEKWEQGKNPISKPAALLMYLIDNDKNVLKSLYNVELNPNFDKYAQTSFTPFESKQSLNEIWKLDSCFENNEKNCCQKKSFITSVSTA